MISPKVEESRIQYALRGCREKALPVYEPYELIQEAIGKFGDNLAVSCSFGSCSVVVLHMALQVKPNIKVVFDNTCVQYPETYAYRDFLVKEWNLNFIETKPIKSFWQCIEEYGPPLIRQTGRSKHKKPQCCIYLKEKPFKDCCKLNDILATLTGIRVSESAVRMFSVSQVGQFYFAKKPKIWKYHPIAFWNHKQVWQYFQQNNIPMNEVYTKLRLPRSGCMPCTGFLNWEKQLARINPKMLVHLQRIRLKWKQREYELLDNFPSYEDEVYYKCGVPKQELLEEWF